MENAGKMLGKCWKMLGKWQKWWEHDEKTAKMMVEGWWDSTKMKGGLEKGTLREWCFREFSAMFFWSLDMPGGSENFPTTQNRWQIPGWLVAPQVVSYPWPFFCNATFEASFGSRLKKLGCAGWLALPPVALPSVHCPSQVSWARNHPFQLFLEFT
jgi:hypothetical protein